jgi:hypothetical protein
MREAYERTIASTLLNSLILPSGVIRGFVVKTPFAKGWRDKNLP